MDRALFDLQRFANELASRPGGERYREELCHRAPSSGDGASIRHYCEHIASARQKLRSCQPHAAVCPYCHQEGEVRPGCRCCRGLGWTNKAAWDAAPADFRDSALEDHGAPTGPSH
jgi:hypothetical protein